MTFRITQRCPHGILVGTDVSTDPAIRREAVVVVTKEVYCRECLEAGDGPFVLFSPPEIDDGRKKEAMRPERGPETGDRCAASHPPAEVRPDLARDRGGSVPGRGPEFVVSKPIRSGRGPFISEADSYAAPDIEGCTRSECRSPCACRAAGRCCETMTKAEESAIFGYESRGPRTIRRRSPP